jgi:putative effector of murein hydrolase
MMPSEVLVVLLEAPFAGVGLTLGTYALAYALHQRLGQSVWSHPILVSVVFLSLLFILLQVDYQTYFDSAKPLHLALGPHLVLLAVPLCRQLRSIRAAAGAIGFALVLGCGAGLVTNLLLAGAVGAPPDVLISLMPRSVTTPAAIGIAESFGGIASLTAAAVIASGIFGAVAGPAILNLLRISDHRAQGLALGVAAHAIGTMRAFQISTQAGSFAAIGMVLNALATIVAAPILLVFLL